MNDKTNNNKENKNNQIFQRIKKSIFQDKEKKIVVVQKKKKKKGNYILGDTIGEGAFAKVKVAKHIYTGEKVAIKILNKEKIYKNEDYSDIEKIKKEIKILQRLKHKNIIQLYEIMETNKSLYIVMEYCEGKELFDYIVQKKNLTEREACRYFQQIINGVEYLHLSNITHRDLKPENLLLDNKKRIIISDFGLSILSKNYQNLLSTPCGTPSYAPPEMLTGKKYNGICSDIWSCGIILYTMLVGNLPCSESKEELVYQNIITHNFFYPENLSDDAIDLIEHLLKINPEERYNFDEIKAHPWFNLLTPKLRPGIVFGVHKIPIDEKILEKVEEFGYDKKKVEESVLNSRYDSFSAVYYLILKQYKKNGINSVSDLYSDVYLNYLKNYKNWINPSKINDPLFKDYDVELLDNLNEDEMLWVPDIDSASDISNIIHEQEDEKIKKNDKILIENNDNNNLDKVIDNIIINQKDVEDIIEKDLNSDKLFNNLKNTINTNKNTESHNISNAQNKNINKMKKNLNKYINKSEISPNKTNNIKRNFTKDSTTNTKSKKIIFNLKKSTEVPMLDNNNIKNKKLEPFNSNNIIINSAKSIIIKSPEPIQKRNKQFSLCDKIIFDNMNELEVESKVLSKNSDFFNDNKSKLNININTNNKNEERKENINKKLKIEISPLRAINSLNITHQRNYNNDLSELTNSSRKNNQTKNSDNYKIKIKRAKKKENDKIILLSEELSKNKKIEIINKLKNEEKKFNEELKSIDNISMLRPIKINKCNDNNMVGQIADKLIKTTIFSKYLTDHKRPKDPLKVDLENKFYILQKYKNILGIIERMRNKIFTKKTNDFNFYTFDEYLNDDNDKMYVKSLLKVPYFNSFIQKAKNTLYQKETMSKRAYSKNYVLKPHLFNINTTNNVLTSHLSSNSNNLYIYSNYRKLKNKKVNSLKKLNTSFTKDKHLKNINDKYKSHTKENSFVFNKISNTTRANDKKLKFKFSMSKEKSYNRRNTTNNNSFNFNSVEKIQNNLKYKSNKKLNYTNININDLTSYNNKTKTNKKYMNDISENEESISSYSSLSDENIKKNKKRLNFIVKRQNTGYNYSTPNKFTHLKNKNIFEEKKMNSKKHYDNERKSENKRNIIKINKDKSSLNKIQTNENYKNNRNNKDKVNCLIMSPYNSKKVITVNLLNEKKERKKNIQLELMNKININDNELNTKKNNIKYNDTIKELKEFTPIDLNYIVNIAINIIIQKTKKYFKKFGYFCNYKDNIIKANKGNSNIEITLYKLKYLNNDNIYLSVKMKNKDLKNAKLFIKDLINNLK